jgi:hypothetical protein
MVTKIATPMVSSARVCLKRWTLDEDLEPSLGQKAGDGSRHPRTVGDPEQFTHQNRSLRYTFRMAGMSSSVFGLTFWQTVLPQKMTTRGQLAAPLFSYPT